MDEWIVEVRNVNKSYGSNHVVEDLSFNVKVGEFLTLLGPSGCGKTTTLRLIGGFEQPDNGSILVEGIPVEDKEPYERDVNTVFQSYALFPHMTIFDNVAYGLKMKKVKKSEIKTRVSEMLEMVQLSGFEKRMPSQLSGGQKQRVAIARALINKPKVLLLDEPLGALDLKLRKQMQLELKRLQKKLNITFIYVTHDQEEALTMSDRIAILNNGVLEQIGSADEIYESPVSRFVATFIGETNIFEGYITGLKDRMFSIAIECGDILGREGDFSVSELVTVSVRPEKVKFSRFSVTGFSISGIVREQIYVGSMINSIIDLTNGAEIRMQRRSGEELPVVGESIFIYWNADDAILMRNRSEDFYKKIQNAQAILPGGAYEDA